MSTGRQNKSLKIMGFFLAAVLTGSAALASAAPRDQARRMHDRLVGTPPSEAVLTQMETLIAGGDPVGAAMVAMQNPDFYNTTLKNFAAVTTNVGGSVFVPLNDMTATIIGLIRDNRDFREVLYADVVYTGGNSVPTPYSPFNNQHYQELEDNGVDLSTALVARAQSTTHPDLANGGAAGVQTTRAAAEAYFSAGTNRRMLYFMFSNFLCKEFENIQDVTRSPDHVRQDVNRSPGGDSGIYLSSCVGCHAGMDALAGAYAYYQFDPNAGDPNNGDTGGLVYTPGNVQPKYLQNAGTFPAGFKTVDDSWVNYWRYGNNSVLGWNWGGDPGAAYQGSGAAALGRELANSYAFAECQAKRVFKTVCLREPSTYNDEVQIQNMANSFRQSGYNMKQIFAESAVYCMGQ